jgi:enoyl-CoA hydratase
MSDLQHLIHAVKGSIAYVTLNRPGALNALNQATLRELGQVFQRAKDDAAVGGVIVTGSGDKAFVAGADIGELAATDAVAAEAFTRHGQAVFNLIETLGKPVIAAINGFALGGGCELAMACTLRLAVPEAQFGQPETKLGVIPGFGGTQRLPRLVGKGRAMELILTAKTIDAAEACRIGLLNEVVPRERLIVRAEEVLRQILANAPVATRLAMQAVNTGLDGHVAEGLALESACFAICAATTDKQEGTQAFLEKRKPSFTGR